MRSLTIEVIKNKLRPAIFFIANYLFILHDRLVDVYDYLFNLYLIFVVWLIVRRQSSIPIIIHASFGPNNINITTAMNYYYKHDRILSCASLYRWLRRFKTIDLDDNENSQVTLLFYSWPLKDKVKYTRIDVIHDVCYTAESLKNAIELEAGDIDLRHIPSSYLC